MKTTLLAGSLALSLFSTAAFADDDCDHPASPPSGTAFGVGYGNGYGYGYADLRDDGDDDDRDDDRYGNGRGRYELQAQQRWVPGATTQVWVAGFCHRPPFSPIQVCTRGHYETRQEPGHYETVQEWVWVEHHHHRHHGNHFGRRYYGRR